MRCSEVGRFFEDELAIRDAVRLSLQSRRTRRYTPSVQITEVGEATDLVVEAFARLVPQLSKSKPPPGKEAIERIVSSDASHLLVAISANAEIVGSLTLVIFPIPTGVRAWIEDVVVDSSVRGQGVGRAPSEHALEAANAAGALTVDLTSRPSREAANRLYKRLGFVERETNVHRYSFDEAT